MKNIKLAFVVLFAVGCGSNKKAEVASLHSSAKAAEQSKEYDKARKDYLGILIIDPTNDDAHLGVARTWILEGTDSIGGSGKLTVPQCTACRSKFEMAMKSLRRVNPSNHLAKATADEMKTSMRKVLQLLNEIDHMGTSLD